MNYNELSKNQLMALLMHLEQNFISDHVVFKAHAMVSNKELEGYVFNLQKQNQALELENNKLKNQVENLKFHLESKSKEFEKNIKNKKTK